MNGVLKYKINSYLEAIGSEEMDSNKLSKNLIEKGIRDTPRQVSNFIRQHMNHIIDIRRVDRNGSYYNLFQILPGTLNIYASGG